MITLLHIILWIVAIWLIMGLIAFAGFTALLIADVKSEIEFVEIEADNEM